MLTALVCILSGCSKDKYEITTALETGYSNDEVVNVATAYLPSFKSLILMDDVSHYGFASPSELDQIYIGTPFLELQLTTDFKNDSNYDCFDKYVAKGREWQVPLMVGNDIRCFLRVSILNDILTCVGGGGSDGASKIDECIKKYNIQSENRYIIEEHVYYNSRFIMTKTGDNLTIFPGDDYIPVFHEDLDKVYYSFEEFFYAFKEEES